MVAETTESIGCRLRQVSPAAVADARAAGTGVRHFDQLDEAEQRAFLRLCRGEPARSVLPIGVVVFTDYYLVEYA